MNSAFSIIKDFINSVKPYLAMITTIVSSLATILTCIGLSLPGILIRLRKWKDRRVLEYIILKARRENRYDMDIIRPVIIFLIELTKIFEVFLAICIIIYSVSPWIEEIESELNKKAYCWIIGCIFILVVSALVRKLYHKEIIPSVLYKTLFLLAGNCIGTFLIVFLMSRSICNDIMFNTILACISLYNFGILVAKTKMFSDKDKRIVDMIKLMRDLGGMLYIISFYVSTVNGYTGDFANQFFFYSWMILCLSEALILIVIKNTNPNIEYQINIDDSVIKTTKSIYQYRCNKVEYSLEDKRVIIINADRIKSIDYTIKNYILGKKKDVICTLENGEILNFDGYKIIKESWVLFYMIDDNGKHIKMINMHKIKSIAAK